MGVYNIIPNCLKKSNKWLAGVNDGETYFQQLKIGYSSLEIAMSTRDKHCYYPAKRSVVVLETQKLI